MTGTRFNGTVANTHRFSNNIFYQGTYDFSTFGDATIQFSNNCYFNNDDSSRPDDAGALIADPQLVAPGSGGDTLASVDGYRLMSESPCINAGISINDSGSADYWGNSAPIGARDVGAHEFQSPTSSPPVPPRNLRVLSAFATSVMLAWNPNSESDLAGYKLHIGIQSIIAGNPPVQVLDVGNVTQSEVQGLDFATQYFFVATAYNNAGLESGYSKEVTFTPMPPVEDKIRYWPQELQWSDERRQVCAAQSRHPDHPRCPVGGHHTPVSR